MGPGTLGLSVCLDLGMFLLLAGISLFLGILLDMFWVIERSLDFFFELFKFYHNILKTIGYLAWQVFVEMLLFI
jgi:hypothetical protein